MIAKKLLKQALVTNPLFLLSAALVLAGAWLLNPPAHDGTRDLALLWKLFVAIQLYELSLLGAASLFSRRAGLERDARALGLVLAPFLVDVTLTTEALLDAALHFDGARPFVLAGAVLVLAAWKIGLAAKLTGIELGLRGGAILFAGPALITTFPVVAYLWGESERALGNGPGPAIALLGGLALGALVLAFDLGSALAGDAGATIRKLAALVLPIAAFHTGATAWTHSGSLLQVAGPALIFLGPASPRLFWPTRGNGLVPLVLPIAGALALGVANDASLGLDSWHWGLALLALAHGREFLRTRSLSFLATTVAALETARAVPSLAGANLATLPSLVEPVAPTALFVLGLLKRANPVGLALSLALAALGTLELHALGGWADAVLACDVIGVGALAWTFRVELPAALAARARFAGIAFLVVPGFVAAWLESATPPLPVEALELSAIAGSLVLWRATGKRAFALPALLGVPFALDAVPRASTTAWGVIGLSLAFVAVGLGVATTLAREKLLAWLESPPETA